MLRQIFTTDEYSLRAMIADGKEERGPKVVAQLLGMGKVEVHAIRKSAGRLQVQLEPDGQWHTPFPNTCYMDVPDA
jgi:hypothetical protein